MMVLLQVLLPQRSQHVADQAQPKDMPRCPLEAILSLQLGAKLLRACHRLALETTISQVERNHALSPLLQYVVGITPTADSSDLPCTRGLMLA